MKQRGFSLVPIMLVLSVIAILMAIVVGMVDTLDRRKACEAKGGTLIVKAGTAICIRKDAIIELKN